jgi:glycosyltransferase involved in cell wall biosynthesis
MKITVVTVAYNAQATIGATLASVAAQRGVDIEHLVIDGASTDDTAQVVAAHARPGLRLISEPDSGLYDAMNKGLRLAAGDAVGFLNADDFFCRTDALALIAAALEATPAAAVSASVAIVGADDVDRVVRHYGAAPFAPWMLRFAHMPPHPGFYVRTAAARQVGAFNTRYRIAADFDWLVRFYLREGLCSVALAATVVAMRQGGASQQGLSAAHTINREAGQSLAANARLSWPPLFWLKYAAKAFQLLSRPPDYPAPDPVRWGPGARLD